MLGTNAQIEQYIREGSARPATDKDKITWWNIATDAAIGAAVPAVLIGATIVAIIASGGTLSVGALALGGAALAVTGAAVAGVVIGTKRRIKFSSAGLTLPDMEIERLEDEVDPETHEKHAVLQLDHVRILDQKVFDRAIDMQEKLKDNPGVIAVTPNFENEPEYSVKIIIKGKEITLAELDYTNWENNPDFKIEITKPKVDPQTKKPVKPVELLEITEEEKKQVLETLGGMSKFLGDKLQHPDELIEEAIDVHEKLKVDMQAPPSAAIQIGVFWEELADVVIRTGKYDMFLRYEKAIKETYETSAKIDIMTKNTEAKFAKTSPLNSPKLRRIFAIISSACLALAALGAVGVVVAFTAPVSIPAFALGVLLTTSIAVATVGSVSAIVSFLTSRLFSIGINLAASHKAEATAANAAKAAQEFRQKQRFEGVPKTAELINDLTKKNTDIAALVAQDQAYKAPSLTLDLSKHGVGDSSAIIAGRWINTRHAKFCHTLKLSNNQITDDGAVSLAKGLATATNVRDIDITKNKIGDKGLKAFSEALAKNTVIRKFAYDKEGVALDIINRIERELLVNNFLFNPDPNNAELQKGVTKFFAGDSQAFEQAAATKIKQLQTLPRMAAFINSFPENIQGALRDEKPNAIKTAVANLKNVVIERQVALLFPGKPLAKDPNELDQALITYIDVYSAATEPSTLTGVDQKQVLSLIKNSLAGPDVPGAKEQLEMRTPSTSPGLKALLDLDEQKRISLLNNCFASEALHLKAGDARGMAMFISSAISTEGFYDPQATSKTILELRKCLILVKEISTLDEYTAYLEAKIDAKKGEFKDSPEDVAIIESALQAAYQGKLEGQFACLLPPFGKPSEEKLAEFKEYLKNNTKIRDFKFPEPNNIDPEVTLAIEETCKRNQILEILKQPHSEATLKKFLEIYGTMRNPEYLRTADSDVYKFDFAGLIKLISLNEDVLTTDSDIYKMVESLKTLSKPACRVLLEIYFQGQEEWGLQVNFKDKALLVATMIKSDGFTAMLSKDYPHSKLSVLEKSTPIDILTDAFNYRTSGSHFVRDYPKLIEILNASIVYRLNEESVDALVKAKGVYEEVLQLTLQEKLEAEYPCLRQPFEPDATGKFLTELNDNFYLRKFDFTGKEALDPAIKAGIDKTIARNKLFDEIHYALIHSRTTKEKEEEIAETLGTRLDTGFALLVAAYKKDPNTFIDYFKHNTGEANHAQDLIMTNIYKLPKEDAAACNNLLKLCFDPKDKEADFKAALITNIISHLPSLSNTEISKILDWAQKKDKADLQEIFMKSGVALQQIWLQTELERKYECLKNNSTTNLIKLKQELDSKLLNNNHDLIYFVIPEGKLNKETVEYINSICNRNILERCVNGEKPDLNMFIWRLNELSPADCKKLVATIDESRMVKLFKDVNIEDLRTLDEERTVILLEKYFASVPATENAHKKAVMIVKLLHSEDPENKAINEVIEYAIKPWVGATSTAASALNYLTLGKLQRSHLANEPYYNFSEIQAKLEKIHAESLTHRPELPQSTIQKSDVLQTMVSALMTEPEIASAPIPKVEAKGVELAIGSALLPPAKVPEKSETLTKILAVVDTE